MSKNITDLITINEKGLITLDYKDIVDMLTDRYRLLYGFDIDVDPRSADGRFIYDVATIINTGVSAINQLYKNLNPLTATGTFLDTLCSLTNVTRFSATKSTALVQLTNNTDKDIKIDLTSNSSLTDNLGNIWDYIGTYTQVTIKSKESVNLKYQCSILGKIVANSFKWTTTTYNAIDLEIYTLEKGDNEESDSELRDRRTDYLSNGVSTIESMKNALTQIEGVVDAKIQSYAGNLGETSTCYVDEQPFEMTNHSVAIKLRLSKVNPPSNQVIFNTINNYITPGITTYQINSPVSQDYYSNTETDDTTITNQYWFNLNGIDYALNLKVYASSLESFLSVYETIANNLVNYLNGLDIDYNYSTNDLITGCNYKGKDVYIADAYFEDYNISYNERPNKGNYFNFVNYKISYATEYDHYLIFITPTSNSNSIDNN